MAGNQALEAAEQYFKLWSQKDYDGSRAYLADDLYFRGPFDTFQRADDLVAAVSLAPITEGFKVGVSGKITSIQAFFDPGPFVPLFESK